MTLTQWEHFFKPEVRKAGRMLFDQGKVSPSKPSDTEVCAYVRPSCRTKLKSQAVESVILFAECDCASSRKGQFCKHLWAILLSTSEKYPDFLESKRDLQKPAAVESIAQSKVQTPAQEAYKLKQSEYRKEQYQKQKARLKNQKQARSQKNVFVVSDFSPHIEAALKFFSENGFELRENMSKDAVGLAKKKLSRVFHPDVGGSHDEILTLNHYTEILLKFTL